MHLKLTPVEGKNLQETGSREMSQDGSKPEEQKNYAKVCAARAEKREEYSNPDSLNLDKFQGHLDKINSLRSVNAKSFVCTQRSF